MIGQISHTVGASDANAQKWAGKMHSHWFRQRPESNAGMLSSTPAESPSFLCHNSILVFFPVHWQTRQRSLLTTMSLIDNRELSQAAFPCDASL
jgi:hypothetical protein